MAPSQTGDGLTFDQVVQRRRYRQLSKLGTALVVLLLVLSILSKQNTVAAPLVLLLFELLVARTRPGNCSLGCLV